MYDLCSGFMQHLVGTPKLLEMCIIFSRLVSLSEMVLCAHFIFNGPSQPQPKPGKDAKAAVPSLLMQHFQEMLTVFGFSWHVVGCLSIPLLFTSSVKLYYGHQALQMQSLPSSMNEGSLSLL